MTDYVELFKPFMGYQPERGFPFSNVYLEDDCTIVEYALAGYKKENLSIDVVDSTLIVEGTFAPASIEPENWVVRNISQRSFTRSLRMKTGTTVQRATFIDGILKIYLKVREVEKSKVTID